jgi:hypothetical protein
VCILIADVGDEPVHPLFNFPAALFFNSATDSFTAQGWKWVQAIEFQNQFTVKHRVTRCFGGGKDIGFPC